jgi:hypothetical protein
VQKRAIVPYLRFSLDKHFKLVNQLNKPGSYDSNKSTRHPVDIRRRYAFPLLKDSSAYQD